MLLAFILAALTFLGIVQVWHIVILAALLGIVTAIDAPARQTFVLEMVGRDDLPSGIALNSIIISSSRVLGPTAAGIALVQFGPAWCFLLNGLTFLAVMVSLWIMEVPYKIANSTQNAPWQQAIEGIRFARQHPILLPLLFLAANMGWFGIPIVSILPAFADVVLHSPKIGYATITAGQGLGSVIGGLILSRLADRYGRGRLIAVVLLLWTLAVISLARQVTIPAAVLMAGMSGFAMVTHMVNINTTLQAVVPDAFRGRVLSLYTLVFFGFSPFGALALGLLAQTIGITNAVALYGIGGGLIGGITLLRWPQVLRQP
jgi:MFS family permease